MTLVAATFSAAAARWAAEKLARGGEAPPASQPATSPSAKPWAESWAESLGLDLLCCYYGAPADAPAPAPASPAPASAPEA